MNQLLHIHNKEKNKEWDDDLVNLLEDQIVYDNTVENNVHLIFVCWLLALEYGHDGLEDKLKQYYSITKDRFQDNHMYLFYVGWMLVIAPWRLGEDDMCLGEKYLLKAYRMQPNNNLYKWACADVLELSSTERVAIAKNVDIKQFDGLGYIIQDYFISKL